MNTGAAIPAPTGKSPAIGIVGAGPAGLACAIVLARAGHRVFVHEQRVVVGGRFHGDFQGLENWSSDEDVLAELARQGIGCNCARQAVRSGVAFDAWGARYVVRSERPLFYLVRRGRERGTLDQDLLGQAWDLGVDVRFGSRVKEADGVTVLAGGPRVADAIAAGYLFETEMGDGCWVCFDNKLAPLGYAYLLVHGGQGPWRAACSRTSSERPNTSRVRLRLSKSGSG